MPATGLDVREHHWRRHLGAAPLGIVCINLLHIAPWHALALLDNAAELLEPGSSLSVYEPFCVDGARVSESNRQFDLSLRQRNPSQGVRDQATVIDHAAAVGLTLREIALLPANNRMITWSR